jgi:tetratricopeptide (TPR) repeat protein
MIEDMRSRVLPWAAAAACLAAVFLSCAWWLPEARLPVVLAVVSSLAAAGALAARDLRLGLAAALLLLGAAAFLSPPEVHLWGDGALRLRNLEEGASVLYAGRFEPLDTLFHSALHRAGMEPEDTFGAAGVLGAVLYLAGLGALLRGMGPRRRAALLVLALAPAWTVFFAGYVESYALLLGLMAVFAGLLRRRARPASVAACALLASAVHLLGLLLLPAALLVSLRRRSRGGLAICAAAGAAAGAWLLLTGGSAGAPGLRQLLSPGPLSRLQLVVFAAPSLLLVLPAVSSRPSSPLLLNLLVWLAAFSVFPLERGAAVDWDLGAVMLAPVLLGLLPAAGRQRWLVPAALGAALLAGPRTGTFLDEDLSLRRYARVVEDEGGAEGLEELAIHMRGLGRLRRAESLLRGAFERSGNGRHLAQLSEVLRMQGRPEEALGAAAEAAELRPDLETVWLQLVLAARDCGRGRTAFEAARRHARTFPDAEELWPLALEALVPDGDPGLAWAAAESSLAGGRRNAPLMINAGTAAWMAARPDLARSRWREAAALDPSDPLALHNLGMLALEEGDTASASGYLQEALDVDPTFEASRRALDGL